MASSLKILCHSNWAQPIPQKARMDNSFKPINKKLRIQTLSMPRATSNEPSEPNMAPFGAAAGKEEPPVATASAVAGDAPLAEKVFYEGNGSNAELAISLLLGATLVALPLTVASIGRRLWISYKFTNKRVIVVTNSPILIREVQVEYSKIKEVRTAPRALGLWGDMVIFLKDGSRLEIAGLERFAEIRNYIEGKILD